MLYTVFLRCFRDPIRVSRIRENHHRVPRIKERWWHPLCRNVFSEREPWQHCHFSNRNHVRDDPGTSPGRRLRRRPLYFWICFP